MLVVLKDEHGDINRKATRMEMSSRGVLDVMVVGCSFEENDFFLKRSYLASSGLAIGKW